MSYKVDTNFYETFINTTKAAIKSMMEVKGPHKILSGLDGVIQFKVVLNACTAIAK